MSDCTVSFIYCFPLRLQTRETTESLKLHWVEFSPLYFSTMNFLTVWIHPVVTVVKQRIIEFLLLPPMETRNNGQTTWITSVSLLVHFIILGDAICPRSAVKPFELTESGDELAFYIYLRISYSVVFAKTAGARLPWSANPNLRETLVKEDQ